MDLILIKVCRQNAEALIDTRPSPGLRRNREELRDRQEAARAEIALALEAKPGTADLSTEETKTSLAARLLAIGTSLQAEPGFDITTAKFIFDLRAAAELLGDLDQLVALVQADDERVAELAEAAGERLTKVNPELFG